MTSPSARRRRRRRRKRHELEERLRGDTAFALRLILDPERRAEPAVRVYHAESWGLLAARSNRTAALAVVSRPELRGAEGGLLLEAAFKAWPDLALKAFDLPRDELLQFGYRAVSPLGISLRAHESAGLALLDRPDLHQLPVNAKGTHALAFAAWSWPAVAHGVAARYTEDLGRRSPHIPLWVYVLTSAHSSGHCEEIASALLEDPREPWRMSAEGEGEPRSLLEYIAERFPEMCTMLADTPELLGERLPNGRLIAHVLAPESEEVARQVLQSRPDLLRERDPEGRSLAHRVAEVSPELATRLITHPTLSRLEDGEGRTVAEVAGEHGWQVRAQGLLSGMRHRVQRLWRESEAGDSRSQPEERSGGEVPPPPRRTGPGSR